MTISNRLYPGTLIHLKLLTLAADRTYLKKKGGLERGTNLSTSQGVCHSRPEGENLHKFLYYLKLADFYFKEMAIRPTKIVRTICYLNNTHIIV